MFKIESKGNNLYRLTNKFFGENKSLEILNDENDNIPIFNENGNFTDQMWKFEKRNISVKRDFHLVIISDILFPIVSIDKDKINFESKSKRDEAKVLNENFVKSINELSEKVENFKGTVINGNLTAFGKESQLKDFKDILN